MEIGGISVSFGADTSSFDSAVSSVKNQLSSLPDIAMGTASSVSGGFSSMIDGVTNFASSIVDVGSQLYGLGKTAVQLGMDLLAPNAAYEQTTVAFTTLMHSATAAKAELQSISDFAAKTPFQMADLDAAGAKMLAFGMSAKDVIPDLTGIGDTLSALGKATPAELGSIVDIFGKIESQGKLTTGIMSQLARHGIDGFNLLSKATGGSVSSLQDMVHKGLIPAGAGIDALRAGMEKVYGGGMAAQAGSFNGLMSTLKDNIAAAWRSISGPLFDKAKQGLAQLGDLVASPAFQNFAIVLGQNVGQALNVVGGAVQWVVQGVSNLWQQIQPLVTTIAPIFTSMATSAVSWGQNLIGGFISGINAMVGPLISGVEQIAQEIANFLGFSSPTKKGPGSHLHTWGPNMVKGLASGIANGGPQVQASIKALTKYFESIGYSAKAASSMAAKEVQAGLTAGLHGGKNAVQASTTAIEKSLLGMGVSAQVAVKAAGIAMSSGLTQQVEQAVAVLPQTVAKAHGSARGAGSALGSSVSSGVGSSIEKAIALHTSASKVSGLSQQVKVPHVTAPQSGKGGISAEMQHVAQQVSKVIKDIEAGFTAFKNFLKPVMKEVGSIISGELGKDFKLAQDLGQQFSKWLKGDFSQAVKDAGPGFTSLGKTILSDGVPALAKVWAAGQDLYRHLARDFLPVIEHVVPPIVRFAGVLADGLGKAIKFIAPYVVEAAQAIGGFVGDITDRIAPIITHLFDQMVNGLTMAWNTWLGVWPYFAPLVKGVWDIIVGVVKISWAIVSGIIKIGLDLLGGDWGRMWTDMGDMVTGVWDGVQTMLQGSINVLIGLIDAFIRGINGIHISIPGVIDWQPSIPLIPLLGGSTPAKNVSVASAHDMPKFATGVQNFGGGLALVGERGPEIVNLPGGSSVYPHASGSLYNGGGSSGSGEQHIIIMLDGYELAHHIGRYQQKLVYLHTGIR